MSHTKVSIVISLISALLSAAHPSSAGADGKKARTSPQAARKAARSATVSITKPTANPIAASPLQPVMLIGEFRTPGPIPFKPGLTAKAVIEIAGGFTELAELHRVRVSRSGKGWIGALDGSKALEEDPFHNIALAPGDSLVANRREPEMAPEKLIETPVQEPPKAEATLQAPPAEPPSQSVADAPTKVAEAPLPSTEPGKIAIIGEANQPGLYLYRPALLREAIEAAGGLKKGADKGKIVIYRDGLNTPDLKKARQIRVDLCKVEKGSAEDVALLPGDVVEAPLRRRSDFFSQISRTFNAAAGQIGKFIGANARPLLTSLVPAAGLALHALGSRNAEETETGEVGAKAAATRAAGSPRNPTQLEAAFMKALRDESPEVQQRILLQVKASLEAKP